MKLLLFILIGGCLGTLDDEEAELMEPIIILKFNDDIENTRPHFHSFNYTTTWILLHYSTRSNLTYYVSKSGGGVNVVVQ